MIGARAIRDEGKMRDGGFKLKCKMSLIHTVALARCYGVRLIPKPF